MSPNWVHAKVEPFMKQGTRKIYLDYYIILGTTPFKEPDTNDSRKLNEGLGHLGERAQQPLQRNLVLHIELKCSFICIFICLLCHRVGMFLVLLFG